MDFRAQRYRDRLRAEGRTFAIRSARRTREMLDGYVLARKGELRPPSMQVLWGRILVIIAAGAAVAAFVVAHATGR